MTPKKSAKKPTKRGRPKGSKTKDRDVVAGAKTRCRFCGSEDRTPYKNADVLEFQSVKCIRCHQTGQEGKECPCGAVFSIPFNRIVLRRTECKSCGTARLDTFWEM